MRYHNLKLVGLLLSFFIGVGALAANVHVVAFLSFAVAAVLFVSVVISNNAIGRANSVAIKAQYDAYVSALNAAQTASVRDLQGADDATVKAVTDKLIEAGTYLGSNPAWRNTRRIITASDVIAWYAEGKAAADAALALIETYVKSRQG